MKKILSILISAIFAFSLFSLTSSAASSEVVYKNSFESGIVDDTFEINYGELKVVEEKGEKFLRCSQQGNKIQFAYGPTDQRNVDISFRIRATNINNATNSTITAFFRSPHIPAWDTISYQLQLKSYQAALIYADRFADDSTLSTLVDYQDYGISVGLWNNVKISTRGEMIIVYVNGDRILETTDDRYGEYGGFGFSASQASFDVDDISITRYYGNSLPDPTANEKPDWAGDPSEKEEADVADTGIIRVDLTTLGQQKSFADNSVDFLNPYIMSVYSWVALGVAVITALAATVGFWILLKKGKAMKLK